MIIDCILDRRDGEKHKEKYKAHDFYYDVLGYGNIGDEITRAIDEGTEQNVKNALCNYIIQNEYRTSICDYINSREWLTDS